MGKNNQIIFLREDKVINSYFYFFFYSCIVILWDKIDSSMLSQMNGPLIYWEIIDLLSL